MKALVMFHPVRDLDRLGHLMQPARHMATLLLAAGSLCLALGVGQAHAGEGHDHGDAAPAANSNGPQRLPDGSVFLPKPAQRQLGLRTLPTQREALPQTVVLDGRVVMDPNAGGRVQALVAGRVEAGPGGLPHVGQVVRKGQVLAFVTPSASAIERSGQVAQLAELRAARQLADQRLARLQSLSDTVPRKEIDAARSEAAGLGERMAALGAGLSQRDTLVSPVSGVIASANVVAGQVVDARELLFEVVDPARLQVEALAFDAGLAARIGSASLAVGEQRQPLRFLGAAGSLREQALPLSFRTEGPALTGLALGQPVQVFVQTRATVDGMAVPAAAVRRNPANQPIVWVKSAPELFAPRVVTVQSLDGLRVMVTNGLQPGDRVVTEGASLVNQIR